MIAGIQIVMKNPARDGVIEFSMGEQSVAKVLVYSDNLTDSPRELDLADAQITINNLGDGTGKVSLTYETDRLVYS